MNKIIIIQHEPLTKRTYKIFCIKEIIDAGYELEYWDLSQLCTPGMKLLDSLDLPYIKYINNLNDFEKQLQAVDINNTFGIIEVFFDFYSRKIYRLVSKYNLKTAKFERYGNTGLPETSENKIKSIIKKLLTPSKIASLIRKIYFNIYCKLYKVRKWDYLLTSCNEKNAIKVNHPDYDLYLAEKNIKPLLDKKYIVFIDTGFGKHPDHIYFKGDKVVADNTLWQSKICKFFDYIEEKYKMPVVIAVHPKLEYKTGEFGGRELIKNNTLNLVINSSYVLQDASTSISFSVLDNKEIGIICTKEYFDFDGVYLNNLCNYFGLSLFNVDKDNYDNFTFNKINKDIRENYVYNYLTSREIENKNTPELLLDFLNSLK